MFDDEFGLHKLRDSSQVWCRECVFDISEPAWEKVVCTGCRFDLRDVIAAGQMRNTDRLLASFGPFNRAGRTSGTVTLTARQGAGFGKSTWSFRHGTGSPGRHRNDVDLYYQDGKLHTNRPYNAIEELGDCRWNW